MDVCNVLSESIDRDRIPYLFQIDFIVPVLVGRDLNEAEKAGQVVVNLAFLVK